MANRNSDEQTNRRDWQKRNRQDTEKQGGDGGVLRKLGSGKVGHAARTAALAMGLYSQGAGSLGASKPQDQARQQAEHAQQMKTAATKPAFDFYNAGGTRAADAEIDEENMSEDEMKREFDQEKRRDTAGAMNAVQADQEQLEEGQGGIRGKLAQLRNQYRQIKQQASDAGATVASGDATTETVNQGIKTSVQMFWTWLHNTLEFGSYSFLIMIVGPLATLATVVHFICWLGLTKMFTIRMKGVEVPLFPPFTKTEAGLRALNFFAILFLWFLAWYLVVKLVQSSFASLLLKAI